MTARAVDVAEPSRWERVLPVVPYLFLLVPSTFALLRDWRPAVLVLSLLGLVWTTVGYRPVPIGEPGRRELLTAIGYLAGMLAILAALVHRDSLFSVTGVGLFVQVFTLLRGWRAYCGVAATAAVLVIARPRSGAGPGDLVGSFVIALLIASVTGMVFSAISQQSEQRRLMIGELRRTSAELAELAEENARLQAELLTSAREAGVLAERQRMAREIHDTIAQGLTGILTQLEAAEESLGDPRVARSRLETIRTLARDNLNEARRSIRALRPAPLDEGPLSSALQQIATQWSAGTGIAATVAITGDARSLHGEVESTLVRVAQEALANVAKHAEATRVGITLSYMEDVVALDVRDNGAGFTPPPPGDRPGRPAEGFGLVAMRQRVARLAGSFELETAPGRGTGISATVPAIPAER